MAFELILVDAETEDFSVRRLAGNSQLGSCPRWARDSTPALCERFFDRDDWDQAFQHVRAVLESCKVVSSSSCQSVLLIF